MCAALVAAVCGTERERTGNKGEERERKKEEEKRQRKEEKGMGEKKRENERRGRRWQKWALLHAMLVTAAAGREVGKRKGE